MSITMIYFVAILVLVLFFFPDASAGRERHHRHLKGNVNQTTNDHTNSNATTVKIGWTLEVEEEESKDEIIEVSQIDVAENNQEVSPDASENINLRSDIEPLITIESEHIKLSTAQNALVYEFFTQHHFSKVLPPIGPRQAVAYPRDSYGTSELRQLVAPMLSEMLSVNLDPKMLYGLAGVTATLDNLFRILQNPNDGSRNDAITASPFWPGFRWTSEQLKVNGHIIPFIPNDTTSMQITLDDVQSSVEANPSARFLVICNPHNPTGVIYNKKNLEAIYTYILQETDLHIISDEMYANSIIHGHKDDYTSAVALDAYQRAKPEQKERVHLVWGFTKVCTQTP